MKIRIYRKLTDGVFSVLVGTEDWSENDINLMKKFGEPEINLGGSIPCEDQSSSDSSSSSGLILDDIYVRIMSESPFLQKFDSRDFGSVEEAKIAAYTWGTIIENRISSAVLALRSRDMFISTEEISEY